MGTQVYWGKMAELERTAKGESCSKETPPGSTPPNDIDQFLMKAGVTAKKTTGDRTTSFAMKPK